MFIITVRTTCAGNIVVRHCSGGNVEKVYPPVSPGYKYVNAEDPEMTFKAMSDRAAQTIFWTELARGFAVTLAHIFKVHTVLDIIQLFFHYLILCQLFELTKSSKL